LRKWKELLLLLLFCFVVLKIEHVLNQRKVGGRSGCDSKIKLNLATEIGSCALAKNDCLVLAKNDCLANLTVI
jgi:hypothetical protein